MEDEVDGEVPGPPRSGTTKRSGVTTSNGKRKRNGKAKAAVAAVERGPVRVREERGKISTGTTKRRSTSTTTRRMMLRRRNRRRKEKEKESEAFKSLINKSQIIRKRRVQLEIGL